MYLQSAVMVPHPPLIIPQIGGGQKKVIQDTTNAYRKAVKLIASKKPDTVIVISPHSTMYADYIHISPGSVAKGSFAQYHACDVRLEAAYDAQFVAALCNQAKAAGFPAGTMGEQVKKLDHASMVPLFFLREAYGGELPVKIVRIGLSDLPYTDHYQLGMLIAKTAQQLKTSISVIASGDLSHRLKEDGPYGFSPEGPAYDEKIMDAMGRAAFLDLLRFDPDFCEIAGECGHRSFVMMAGCFDGFAVQAERLSYQGPFGVGYGVCTFLPTSEDSSRCFLAAYLEEQSLARDHAKQAEDAYVRLARQSLESYIFQGKPMKMPASLPDEMTRKRAGVFVSLKKHGKLRGCIGTISAATQSIAQEIMNNAVSAGTQDPRFDHVLANELDELVYSVDVLGGIEDIASTNELDTNRYGVIVSSGYKRGLLLPNLPGIHTVTQQIEIAKQKAGIDENEQVTLQRFEVVRHF